MTTVVVEGGQAYKSYSFFAADPTEFGHADQERKSGAFADPGNAQHQIKASSEIAVSAQLLGNIPDLGQPSRLEPGDVRQNHARQPEFVDMFYRVLKRLISSSICSRKVRSVGQLQHSRIWRDFDLIQRRRTGRDLHRVERVVLGAAQTQPAEPALARLCPPYNSAVTYFGYLNSGAAFSASLVVFIVATHLSFLVSRLMLTEDGDTAT